MARPEVSDLLLFHLLKLLLGFGLTLLVLKLLLQLDHPHLQFRLVLGLQSEVLFLQGIAPLLKLFRLE